MLAEVFGVDGIIVLIVVVVLLFGGAAIPKLARNLGSAKNEFEKGLDEGKKAAHARHPRDPRGRPPARHRCRPRRSPSTPRRRAEPGSAIGFEDGPTDGGECAIWQRAVVRSAERTAVVVGPLRRAARPVAPGRRLDIAAGDSRRGSIPFVTRSVRSLPRRGDRSLDHDAALAGLGACYAVTGLGLRPAGTGPEGCSSSAGEWAPWRWRPFLNRCAATASATPSPPPWPSPPRRMAGLRRHARRTRRAPA